MTNGSDHAADQAIRLGTALRIIDDYVEEISQGTSYRRWRGLPVSRLPDFSFDEAQRKARVGRGLVARLAELDDASLPDPVCAGLDVVRLHTARWARADDWYWLVVDPDTSGFFGMFGPTPYCGGILLNEISRALEAHRFDSDGDADRYLALVADLARLVEQMNERTAGQAERGIRLPKAQALQARGLLAGLGAAAPSMVRVAPDRYASSAFADEIERGSRNGSHRRSNAPQRCSTTPTSTQPSRPWAWVSTPAARRCTPISCAITRRPT